ncbi:MAG: NifU N-terminal domain-containing protein [Leptospiraceae bacterium]|nr:NifU N-terminal domain-containing protein [Leptospiraceae bacterium]
MSLISKFLSIFKPIKTMPVNDSPLQFSKEAILQIKSHLENRPANVKSAFKVNVVYKREKSLCQVGFDDYKMIRKTLFEYPVPLIISEKDELFLRGAYIDYHKEEAAYFYYPNIHLEVMDRSNESIFVFYLDRYVVASDSANPYFFIDRKNVSDSTPYLIEKIFNSNQVESLYIEKNFLSMEKRIEVDKKYFEERMSDIILSYFETCGYPIYITDGKVEVRQLAK